MKQSRRNSRARRAALLVLALGGGFLLSGCATVWKTMGVATVTQMNEASTAHAEDVARLEAEIGDLKTSLDAYTAKMVDAQKAIEDVARIEDLVRDIQGKIDLLPADMVQRLIELLTKAEAELRKASR